MLEQVEEGVRGRGKRQEQEYVERRDRHILMMHATVNCNQICAHR